MLLDLSQVSTPRSLTHSLKENDVPLKKDVIAHSDPKMKATILNEQFSRSSQSRPSLGKSLYPDMHTFSVKKEGVQKLLQGLNPHKAERPDRIPTRFLKEFAAQLTPAMTLIFQGRNT